MTKVLDHGYVTLVESWGSEEGIIEAARMSTGKGFLGWGPLVDESRECSGCGGLGIVDDRGYSIKNSNHPYFDTRVCPTCEGDKKERKSGDEKLLRFLYENAHATPFEMAGATFEVQAPIFVFREWHRHRTQSYNEMSARYAPLPDVNYVPTVERLLINSKTNKQAGAVAGANLLTELGAQQVREHLQDSYYEQEQKYQMFLSMGVPKELARVHLPVGRYSRMRASTDLRNWLSFLTLREAPNAQWEIRQYANAVHGFLKERFPRTVALFEEGRR